MMSLSPWMILLLLSATADVTGRVTDKSGVPLAGVAVVVSESMPIDGPRTQAASSYPECGQHAVTDDGGNFVLSDLPSDRRLKLSASHLRYQPVTVGDVDATKPTQLVIAMEPVVIAPETQRISGTILGLDHQPVPGAKVNATYMRRSGEPNRMLISMVGVDLVTDASGRFEVLPGNDVTSVNIRASAPRSASQSARWDVTNDKEHQMVLTAGASVRGRLIYQDKPLASVAVGLTPVRSGPAPTAATPVSVSTDQKGQFSFDYLPPNQSYMLYSLTGKNAKGVLTVHQVDGVNDSQQSDLGDINAEKPTTLKVSVKTDDGSAIAAESYVYVSRPNVYRGSRLDLESQPNVTVSLDDVGRESFRIRVRVPGWKPASVDPVVHPTTTGRYPVKIQGPTHLRFTLTRDQGGRPR
ncbi:carboxypeptidase regulatory-like domain-containing protein [Planctomycetes bacterium K23_9]|uniref:Nickel uptake substrate-specific transmembrane region n=1 Tax=Stieleria marina TaxID=1930275 RepID=A0A517NX25_9BACT|nr:Nickel uptake substrate-specific transmembrane region [Planctomycetes bacterium K23_9]